MSVNILEAIKPKPFLKWAGGKKQLIPVIEPILGKYLANNQNITYIEPFVGGGAVLFYILANYSNIKRIVINDINQDLIHTYGLIKADPEILITKLKSFETKYYSLPNKEAKKNFFLQQRQLFNLTTDKLERSILLLFLNKTCFNGLYRVNSKGLFNVPFGDYVKPKICDQSNLIAVFQALQKAEIICGDFEYTLNYIKDSNTIFYLDPPYKPIKNTSAFTAYSKENFNDQDQIRLKDFCDQIDQQNAKFILSNSDLKNFEADNHFFDHLYENYLIQRVKAKRSINSKGKARGEIYELLISNISC